MQYNVYIVRIQSNSRVTGSSIVQVSQGACPCLYTLSLDR